jgi:hypothetical protein
MAVTLLNLITKKKPKDLAALQSHFQFHELTIILAATLNLSSVNTTIPTMIILLNKIELQFTFIAVS